MEAYLSNTITIEELESIKQQYCTAMNHKECLRPTVEPAKLQIFSQQILSCDHVSDIFLKTLLDSMTVYKGGHVELRLNNNPALWHFDLHLSNGCLYP